MDLGFTPHFRFLVVSDVSLHSSAVLAETCLQKGIEVDAVLVLGPFAFGDYLTEDGERPASSMDQATPRKFYEDEGEATSIIGQLENIGRVVHLSRSQSDHVSNFTVSSSNCNGEVVELADSLFTFGIYRSVDRNEIEHHLSAAQTMIELSDEYIGSPSIKPAIILLSNLPPVGNFSHPSLLLHICSEFRQATDTRDLGWKASEPMIYVGSLRTCGEARVVEAKGVSLDTKPSFPSGAVSPALELKWEIARQEKIQIDTKRLIHLPVHV